MNFKCDDAEVLDEILQKPLKGGDYGFEGDGLEIEDDEVDDDGEKLTIDTIPVGLFLSKKPDEMYWSFCREHIMQDDHDSHCMTCGYCRDWHHWHCDVCNTCTYGQSIPGCMNCKRKRRGGRRGFGGFRCAFDDDEDSDAGENGDCVLQ